MTRRGILTLVVVLSALAPALEAQEWTRFRGPNGSGIVLQGPGEADAIPLRWSESDFTWRVPLPGVGHSHPVIWGDKVFVTSAEGEGRKRLVLCFSTVDGAALWSRDFAMTTHSKHPFNSFASSTPAVDADHVYVAFATPEAFVLRAYDHNGNEKWSRDLDGFVARHGFGSSPMVFEDTVVIQSDKKENGFLLAVDRKTGKTKWKTERRGGDAAYGTPCVFQRPGREPELLFNSNAYGISSVDARTGKLLWEAPLYTLRAVSSPVFTSDGALAFGTCGSGSGGNFLIAVKANGEGDVSQTHLAYKLEHSIPYVPTPVVRSDRLYLWSEKGIAACYKASTGEELWRERVPGTFWSSPVLIGDRLYSASVEGDVVVIAAADEFKELARNPIGEGTHATPAVADGRLYLRTFGHLICIAGKK